MSEERQDTEETVGEGSDGQDAEGRDHHGWGGWSSSISGIPEMVSEVMDTALRGLGPVTGSRSPRYDLVRVPGEGYVVLVDLPGVDKKALEVTTEGHDLTISGRREPPELPEGGELMKSERPHGRFRRTMHMPADVDASAIGAKLDSGILRVTLPRRRDSKTQHVEVEVED